MVAHGDPSVSGVPVDVPRISAELVADARASLGEGPVWDEREQCVWWVDILGESIHRTEPLTGQDDVIPVGQMVGALGLRQRGGLVVAVRDGFISVDPTSGRIERIADVEADRPSARMNDGKVDPQGRFWAGTTDIDHRPALGTLYRLDADLTVSPMLSDVTISNGLDWTADGATMYFIDTPTRQVDRFSFEPTTGSIGDRRKAVSIRPGAGNPDGMTLDAEDHLWVALWDGWAVERYSPDGTLELRVDVPAAQTTSCTFGGADLGTMFITTAQKEFPDGGKPDQPHAGGLFACRTGVRGRPAHRFAG
jgi:sugar lactone lactonase YvrE